MTSTATSSCPKCGAARGDATACPNCGLRADKVATFTSLLEAAVPDVARAAWERVQAQWEDTAAHDELLRLTNLHGCYAWVAARYREVRGDQGPPFRQTGSARDALAERQLDRIRRAAELALLSSGTRRPDHGTKAFRSTRLLLAVAIILIAVGLLFAAYQGMRTPRDPPAPSSKVR